MSKHSHSRDLIPTRRSLIARLKNWDDKESWQDFFNTYWNLLYRVALKAGLSDNEAQDVVQETIIAVAKKIPGFKYDPALGSFKGWLLHMTRWKIAYQFRKRQRHEKHFAPAPIHAESDAPEDAHPAEAVAPADFEKVWDDEWKKNLFDAAVARVKLRVNPKHYQIYDLYVLKGWPVERVITTLGVNRGQVYLAKNRISALLQEELKQLNSPATDESAAQSDPSNSYD
jgi:RNA polymerase sigma factor (sigma-70 family)